MMFFTRHLNEKTNFKHWWLIKIKYFHDYTSFGDKLKDIITKFCGFLKFYDNRNRILLEVNFWNFDHS